MEESYTLKLSKDEALSLVKKYKSFEIAPTSDYIFFSAAIPKCQVYIYQDKHREITKITFKGEGSYREAKRFSPSIKREIPPEKEENLFASDGVCLDEQIGSDEVGVGDFFGPVCVCASHIDKKDIVRLKYLGVKDSKKMSDEYILKIGPSLIKEFEYSQVSVNDEKYNELISKGNNLNGIKARLHNQALLHLVKKHHHINHIFMDQFASPDIYYKYLSMDREIVRNITFHTKGESLYPSVALASVIARYSFLKKMELLNKKYGVKIPFGAGEKVTDFAKRLIKKIGREEFDKIVKHNFKNYDEVISGFEPLI
ncbi:MAG: ribonuclease HIII [Bacilli bacterium]|jgi:ribonuclease HIII